MLLRVNYTRTSFIKLRDAKLQSVCTNLISAVNPFITAFEPYKVKPESIGTLADSINSFDTSITKPQESIEKKKEATEKMALLIKNTAQLLKTQLDLLMVGFQTTEPEFVQLYTTLRRIKKNGSTKLSLTTNVENATNLLPIEGAELKIVNTKIKRTSSVNGNNLMNNVMEESQSINWNA